MVLCFEELLLDALKLDYILLLNCFTVMEYSGNSFYSKTYHEEHCWNPGVQHGSRTKRHYTLQKPLAGRMWGGLLRKQLTPCRPAALSRRMWALP